MGSRRLLLLPGLVAGIAVTAACGVDGVSPNITGLDRMSASFQETGISVRIDGSGFAQRVVPDTADPSRSTMQNPTVEFGGVAVLSSYLGPNAIQVSFSGSGEQIPYGSILVKVTNPDGSSDTFEESFTLIGPATAIVFGTNAEPAPGTANAVSITYYLVDGHGNVTSPDGAVSFPVGLSTSATAIPANITIPSLSTGGELIVNWTRVGDVEIVADGGVLTTLVPGRATFIAGPASRLAVVPGQSVTWVGPNGDIPTSVHVQDAWGNAVVTTGLVSFDLAGAASASCGNPCPTFSYTPSPIDIPQGAGSAAVTLLCTQQPVVGSPSCAHARLLPGTQPTGWTTTGGVYFWVSP